MEVLNTLLPVVLLILLGVYLGRSGFMPERKAVWANQLCYWIALPCLLFIETSRAKIDFTSGISTLAVVLITMVLCIGLGYLVARMLNLPASSRGAFVQAGFRGNLAYIGIPVVMYSVGSADKEAAALCMLVVAGTIPFYNIAAVLVLLAGQPRADGEAVVGTVFKQLISNPLILACVAGIGFSLVGLSLPMALHHTLEPLGKMALPLALLSIGVTLDLKKIHGMRTAVTMACLVKVALAPLMGWWLGRWVGLNNSELRIALVMLAAPTAAASYVMADLLKSDSHLTAGVIVMSTVLSLAPMMIITWAFG